jgi:hypothetical protein
VAYRVLRHRAAEGEFLQLPPDVRAIYERAIRRMATDPFQPGPGFEISQPSPPKGVVAPIGAMKVRGFRMFFVVDGDLVKIGGFGGRPGFYRKLARAKELLRS